MANRVRPFLEKPVYHGCPISWARKFFQGKLAEFREKNKDFDAFLEEIKQEITNRDITYCENILRFINGNAETNWISPTNSLFTVLLKYYNYDFNGKQAVDHIETCYKRYQEILNDKLKMYDEYELFTARTTWDSSIRDFVKLYLAPKQKDLYKHEPYFILMIFCSLQVDIGYPDFDNKIELVADESTYNDALCLFDPSVFYKRIKDIAIKELIKNKVVDEEPTKAKSRLSKTRLKIYRVETNRYLKIKKNKRDGNYE